VTGLGRLTVYLRGQPGSRVIRSGDACSNLTNTDRAARVADSGCWPRKVRGAPLDKHNERSLEAPHVGHYKDVDHFF